MVNLDMPKTSIYDNVIEFRFHEYFENRGIDINSDYKDIPNNRYHAAFIYCYEKCFCMDMISGKQRNKLTDDLKGLYIAYNTYVKLIREFNIVSFTQMFLEYIGIEQNQFNLWNNKTDINIDTIKAYIYNDNYIVPKNKNTIVINDIYNNSIPYKYSELLNSIKFKIFKNIYNLNKSSVRGKLADDRTGMVVLANNDSDIGLEYEKKRTDDRLESTVRLATQLPKLSVTDGKIDLIE